MRYSIGKYKVVPPKPFANMDEAVEYIQNIYPELERVTIDQFLTPKITNNGDYKSGNLSEENSDSNQGNPEAGSAGAKRIKPNSDKSGQPIKG